MYQQHGTRLVAVLLAWGLAWTAPLAALEPPSTPTGETPGASATAPSEGTDSAYVRVRDEEGGVRVLELASVTFVPAKGDGPRIHLVGAVHIADKTFYETMQASLDKLDLVLFEGVKPPGAGTLDASATEDQKIKATQGRMRFLKALLEQQHAKNGAFPKSLGELVEGVGKRWKTLVQASLEDAWGHALRFESRLKGEGDAAAEAVILTSDGPDGKPGAAGGDDLRLEVVAKAEAGQKQAPGLQAQLAKALGLVFQLEAMDSGKANWRSSDMSMDELQAKMDAAGADSSTLLGMLDGSSLMGKLAGFMLAMVAQSPQMSAMVKMTMVEVLGSGVDAGAMGGMGGAGGGAGGGGGKLAKQMQAMMKVIVEQRNEVVVSDLRGVIEKEKTIHDVAVFYGAGHMGDLQKKLVEGLGYTRGETAWTTAIRVDPKDAGMTPEQAKTMRDAMKRMIERQTKGK